MKGRLAVDMVLIISGCLGWCKWKPLRFFRWSARTCFWICMYLLHWSSCVMERRFISNICKAHSWQACWASALLCCCRVFFQYRPSALMQSPLRWLLIPFVTSVSLKEPHFPATEVESFFSFRFTTKQSGIVDYHQCMNRFSMMEMTSF